MAVNGETTLRVLMFGFEEPLASELGEALANEQAVVRTCPPLTAHDGFASIEQASILFCAAEPDYYRPLLAKIKGAKLQLPVVIVGRRRKSANGSRRSKPARTTSAFRLLNPRKSAGFSIRPFRTASATHRVFKLYPVVFSRNLVVSFSA